MASLAMNHILERIALFQFTPTHCVQARAMLGWSVEQLSREAEVAVDDIQRFEAQQDVPDAARLALAFDLRRRGWCSFRGLRRVAVRVWVRHRMQWGVGIMRWLNEKAS